MTLLDGTEVKVGDIVLAKIGRGPWRNCEVLELLKGGGVDRAILAGPAGNIIRSRYRIKVRRTEHRKDT